MERAIQKSDFWKVPNDKHQQYRERLIDDSVTSAMNLNWQATNPLSSFQMGNKHVYKLDLHKDKLLERRITHNLQRSYRAPLPSREEIICNIKYFLKENVSYDICRLDIRNYYESFSKIDVIKKIKQLETLSPKSKVLIETLLDKHRHINGHGIPRGLTLSATLAEMMMRDFDEKMRHSPNIFFYARYVDDLFLITSGKDTKRSIKSQVKSYLPKGLNLNPKKLQFSSSDNQKEQDMIPSYEPKAKTLADFHIINIDYLGYRFTVKIPLKNTEDMKTRERTVLVKISPEKIKKYKFKISRAFCEYNNNKDARLLCDRIKYLSINFRITDPRDGKRKLSGIYYNYPSIDKSNNLKDLDFFLRRLVFDKAHRLSNSNNLQLSPKIKRELLSNNFSEGHAKRKFAHFSLNRISIIKGCWKW